MVDTGEVLIEKNVRPRGRIRDAFGALIGKDDKEEDVVEEVNELIKKSRANVAALEAMLGGQKSGSKLSKKLESGTEKAKDVEAVEQDNKQIDKEEER